MFQVGWILVCRVECILACQVEWISALSGYQRVRLSEY